MTISVPDRNIDVFACEVDMVHGGRHPKVDLGMDLGKPPKPVDEPGDLLAIANYKRPLPSDFIWVSASSIGGAPD